MILPDSIPYRIRIGVTGHRVLEKPDSLANAIEEIFSSRYLEAFTQAAVTVLSTATATPVSFTIISPLAEGADRLVADVALVKGALLEAILPMPRPEYERDFATSESRKEFGRLFDQAHRTVITDCGLPPDDPGYRRKSYRLAGEETIAKSDIIIALWDGTEPTSDCGTGAIANLAIQKGKPVFIVSASNPVQVELVNGGVLTADSIAALNMFNSFHIEPEKLANYAANEYEYLFPPEVADPLPDSLKETVRTLLIPAYCRTSIIAKSQQQRYYSTGKRAYLYSTFSVAFMAAAIVFAQIPAIALPGYMIELTLLVLLYLMIHKAVHDRVHHGWLEHRVLAERLRMAFYFVACGETPVAEVTGKTVHHHAGSWVDHAYREIIYVLPDVSRPVKPPVAVFSNFIRNGWLAGQLKYHVENRGKASLSNKKLKRWGMQCFALAIVVSVIHHLFAISAALGNHAQGMALLVEELLSIVAVTLPAAGAAVNGYRSLLEHSRIASRSAGMVHHLERLMNRPLPETPEELRHNLERIEDLMLMESQDWQKFMEHAELDGIA